VTALTWLRTPRRRRTELDRMTEQATGWRDTAMRRARLVEDYADQRNRATERMLTAQTLLVQLYRGADLGEPPRDAGRPNLHAIARALGQALTDTRRAARPAPVQPARAAQSGAPSPAEAATQDLGAVTMQLPVALQRLVRGFRMAPVIAGVTRWDLSRPVPDAQLPAEVEMARALMRVETALAEMTSTRPDLAGWAARLRAAAAVPVGFSREEVRT
jgi:hypothetical protein